MIYQRFLKRLLFDMDAEKAHEKALRTLRRVGKCTPLRWSMRQFFEVKNPRLTQTLFGITFPNPVGLAAGMDKAGLALRGFEALGFGFLEMGGITALKQPGNPRPRVFRLPLDYALINRMGFNNPGAEETAYHLAREQKPDVPLGINIGKSKSVEVGDIESVVADYCYTLRCLYDYASFFVVNVSSPNTPGLRTLQGKRFLTPILLGIKRQNEALAEKKGKSPKPILLKISPDLTNEEIDEILEVVTALGIHGIVAVNTTVQRSGLLSPDVLARETGGLSGAPLRDRAREIVSYIRARCPSLPIIGVGGISSGEDAWDMIRYGANLVQILTGLIYEGPGLVKEINRDLLKLMDINGVGTISDFHIKVKRS